MGRKKIEIRPLTDERNRNVTFLKRKAGLMKKAWELSVLCAADVSIVIFSAAGKPYEFSSKDLDEEIDRYLDYEGLIERRRAPEFAAMALAGEDSDDDDEGPSTSRRASTAKNAAANGAPPPNKSLKGKESYKNRMPSKAEVSRTIAHYRQKAKGKGRGSGRRSHRRSEEKKSFIDGILEESDSESSSDFDEEVKRGEDDRRKRRRRQDEVKTEAEGHGPMAGLHYAMGLHQQPQQEMYARDGMLASAQHSATRSTTGYYRQVPPIEVPQMTPGGYPPPQPVRPSYSSEELDYAQAQAQQYRMHEGAAFAREVAMQPQHQHQQHHSQQSHSQPIPQNLPMLPGNMQWDQNLLARYAEFQLQQNHQRQQRILLERQRSQLAELGIPLEDKTLLDQLFGVGGASGSAQALNHENIGGVHSGSSSQEPQYTPPGIPTPHDHGPESGLATGDWAPRSNPAMSMGGGEFEWPTLNGRSRQKEAYAEEQYRAPGADDIPWGIGQQPHLHGQQDEMPFPTPGSPANIRA